MKTFSPLSPSPAPTDDRRAYDVSVALWFAALAARAWSLRTSDPEALVETLMRGASWVNRARATAGCAPVSLDTFIKNLACPVEEWLPGGPSDRMLEGEIATLACEELACAHADPCSQVEQSVLRHILEVFAQHPDGAVQYARLRRTLIEHPTATPGQILDLAGEARVRPDELYEPIGAECLLESADGEACFAACPRCNWPMWRDRRSLRCRSDRCFDCGARFELGDDGKLLALGSLAAPTLMPRADRRRLLFGLWRFTVLPGLAELALHDALLRISGVHVELWPELDRYDLDVQRGTERWRIDVKDWASGWWLARELAANPPTARLYVVVPDHRTHQLPILRELCIDIETYRFHDARSFVDMVAARESVDV